jgi:hypothetical protein
VADHSEYMLITGNSAHINTELKNSAAEGWRPILMTTLLAGNEIRVFVILEHPPVET